MKKLIAFTITFGLTIGVLNNAEAAPLTDEEVKTICRTFPFSSDAKPLYGCRVAAALDMMMLGTVNGVAKQYNGWSVPKQERYLEGRLPRITRWYTYNAYFWNGADKNAMFRKNHASYMDNDGLATFLQAPATRLDVVRAMRGSGRRSSSARKVKRTRLKVVQKKSGKRCTTKCPAP